MASDTNSSQVFKTHFWPQVRQYIRSQLPSSDGCPQGECPVCFDELDIVKLPTNGGRRFRAKIFPCGHMVCAKCLPALEDADQENCPTCRSPITCQECPRTMVLDAPTSFEPAKAMDRIPLTINEGGVVESTCLDCVVRKNWDALIKEDNLPAGVRDLQLGFVDLVYNTMSKMEREGTSPRKTLLQQIVQTMIAVGYNQMRYLRREWQNRMRRGEWPPELANLMPGLVPFIFSMQTKLIEAGQLATDTRITSCFKILLDRHYDMLVQARNKYIADEVARLKPTRRNVWFATE